MEQFVEGWSRLDNENAIKQGWNLFNADGKLELQKIDILNFFKTDMEAWKFVTKKANEGDETAKHALTRLFNENPEEYEMVVEA